MKILIVEDDSTSLKLAAVVLRSQGHRVRQAVSAEAAIAALSDAQPQVILLDLALPGINGLCLARKLKEDKRTKGIPIVAMTAYPRSFSSQQALEAGCDCYILKPVNTRTLGAQLVGAAGVWKVPKRKKKR